MYIHFNKTADQLKVELNKQSKGADGWSGLDNPGINPHLNMALP